MMVKYAFSQSIINPSEITNLAGFSYRQKYKETLGPDKLYVKIVWLKANKDLIFISVDSLYFSSEVAENIFKYAFLKFKVIKDNIVLNASHTHSAPNQDLEIFGNIDREYLKDVEAKIKQGLEFCYDNFQEGFIEFQHLDCKLNLFVNRRKMGRDIRTLFLRKRTIMLPNEKKKTDKRIHLIKLYDSGLKLKGIVYNFSCHPVFNVNKNISSDFIGTISNMLGQKICKFTMFLQGFAGDVRPNFTETKVSMRSIKNFLKLLFNEKVFSNYNQEQFSHFCEEISACIIQNAGPHYRDVGVLKINRPSLHIHNSMYGAYLESKSTKVKKFINIKLILISDNLFISIPAEVHSCYIDLLTSRFRNVNIYPLGYADGMIGYLPCENEIEEGGYEVLTSVKLYGWDDRISKLSVHNFTNQLISEISKLLESRNA